MKTNFKLKTQLIAFAYVLLAVVFLIGCTESNVNKNSTGVILTNGSEDVKIIVIDSCEYIEVDSGVGEFYRYTLTHKGNCKFCLSRSEK